VPVEALSVIGRAAHRAIAADIADGTVTLVKDTAGNLPITPETHPRIRLYRISGGADFTRLVRWRTWIPSRKNSRLPVFDVHVFRTAEQREAAGEAGMNFMRVLSEEATGDYAEKYQPLLCSPCEGVCAGAAIRSKWASPMAAVIPWYVTEVPTVLVWLNQPNHLIDVPMVKTAILAHAGTREAIRQLWRPRYAALGQPLVRLCYLVLALIPYTSSTSPWSYTVAV
jgi:beta-N-acetylhexosaminidase